MFTNVQYQITMILIGSLAMDLLTLKTAIFNKLTKIERIERYASTGACLASIANDDSIQKSDFLKIWNCILWFKKWNLNVKTSIQSICCKNYNSQVLFSKDCSMYPAK